MLSHISIQPHATQSQANGSTCHVMQPMNLPSKQSRPRRKSGKRTGTASVEVAIILPVLFTLTFATMDLCSLFFLREAVTLAAYEGARAGVPQGATGATSTARINEFLDERGIIHTNAATFSAPGFDTADALDNVTVTVTVPCAGNLLMPDSIYQGWNVSASVTMRKEFQNRE